MTDSETPELAYRQRGRVPKQRLMRVWHATDVTPDEPEYVGTFSDPFRAEEPGRRIVDVDWSTPGEVQVTWLVACDA